MEFPVTLWMTSPIALKIPLALKQGISKMFIMDKKQLRI